MELLKYTLKFIVLLKILLFPPTLNAQSPSFIYFTDDHGLPSMTVYGIRQDVNGFLWMTTTKGICRFNGKEFKKYAVPDIKVQDFPYLFMDAKGVPWFYNLAGEIICIQNDSIINTGIKNSDPRKKINSLYSDNGVVYISWWYEKTIETRSYTLTNLNKQTLLKKPYSVIGRYNSDLLATDLKIRENKFQLFSISQNKLLYEYQHKTNETFNYHAEINLLSELSQDSIAIITPYFSGLFNSKFELQKIYKFREILNDTVLFVSLINQKELFIKTNYNSYIFNLGTNEYEKVNYFGNSINTIYEDNLNRKWITTTNKGLILLPNEKLQIYTSGNSEIQSNEVIRIIGDSPLHFFNHNNSEISIYNSAQRQWNKITIPGARGIRSIIKIKSHDYFIGSDNGLYQIKGIEKLKPDIHLIKQSSIKDLYQTPENKLFILTSNGTYLCSESDLSNPDYKLTQENALIKSRSTSIINYKDTILAATLDGIYFYERNGFTIWKNINTSKFYINKLYNQHDSVLWICTDGHGIYSYRNGVLYDSINLLRGLPSNSVSSLAFMDNSNIVIGTDNGAFVYNSKSHKGFGFNKLDGLPANEILDIIKSDELLWLGTAKGLVSIPAQFLKPNTEIPYINIKSVHVYTDGKQSIFKSTLPYYANHLRLNLETRSLISKDEIKIYYKLHDTDSNWIETKGNVLELIGLAPGNYNLTIKAINEDGIFSESPANISFTILQIWWKTWWFISLLIILFILLSIGITQWRQNKIKREEDKKRKITDQMNQLRQQALQNQMNPHFIFNSLNAIQSFLLVNDELNAVNYLSKFGKLIRMIFDQSKMKNISLQDELDLLHHYIHLEKLRFGDKVNVSFIVEKDVLEAASEIFIPPLLIQPIIENSFRHGLFHLEEKGILKIKIQFDNGSIKCTIEDNGIGRMKSKQINEWKNKYHKSSGIKSTKERLEILDKGRHKLGLEIIDLYDQNGNASGTKAILKL